MTYNMDWLRAIIDKAYVYLSGLSDFELYELICVLCIALAALLLLPELPDMCRWLRQKHKTRNGSPNKSPATDTTSKVVTLSADSCKTSSSSKKSKNMTASAPRASSVKPELDVEELKKILNMK